ncbi:MAG: arginine decarboxylase, pyruvoyl-dependent [Deltaproteobacteria bacterium]|nr:MAG: arginine decarboxylase, pyruvoyl-dependent [Deltaproteobacteria bacterium]
MIFHASYQHFFFATGSAEGATPLNAFDGALLASGIGNTNLIKISSILPPGCELMDCPLPMVPGKLIPVAYGSIYSDIPGERIAAGVAVAIPEDETLPGVIMEYSSRGHKEEIETIVRGMAEEAFKVRKFPLKEILSKAVDYVSKGSGAVFAGVALWE